MRAPTAQKEETDKNSLQKFLYVTQQHSKTLRSVKAKNHKKGFKKSQNKLS